MTNIDALKTLYAALGGTPADVTNAVTNVDVLNAIAALFEGEDDATQNAEAIANIAAVAGNISPDPTLITKSITANGTYNASSDNADGYSSVTVNVPAQTLTGFDEVLAVTNDHVYIGYYAATPTKIEAVRVQTSPWSAPEGLNVLGVVIGWSGGPE